MDNSSKTLGCDKTSLGQEIEAGVELGEVLSFASLPPSLPSLLFVTCDRFRSV